MQGNLRQAIALTRVERVPREDAGPPPRGGARRRADCRVGVEGHRTAIESAEQSLGGRPIRNPSG